MRIRLILLLQSIPAIPPGIKGEGLIAVLFLIILGWVAAIYAVNKIPRAIAPLVASIDRLVASNISLGDRVTKLEDKIESLDHQTEAVRSHIHVRVAPAIAGLTIAYLRLVGFGEYADQIQADNPDAALPPKGHPK